MIGPEVQGALFAALVDGEICDGRVYDTVPPSHVFPYVTIGDEQVLDDSNSCGEGWDVVADIHVWSRPASGSQAEAKTIRAAIHPIVEDLAVPGFVVNAVTLEASRSLTDPDGITKHAVLTYRFSIDPA